MANVDQCDECGGKCCKGILLPLTSDYSVNRWLELHGASQEIVGKDFVYVDARCKMLGDSGQCRGYEDRPQVCRDFQVGGVACNWSRTNVK
jgi:Fe-S-cluster containining protein